MDKFLNYIGNTWLQTNIRSPEARSAFFQIIRTNNDAEGWQNKLNTKGKGAGLNFYKLVQLLFSESEFVQVEKAYLKLHQTTRPTRLEQKVLQTKLLLTAYGKFLAYGKSMIGTKVTRISCCKNLLGSTIRK